MFILQAALILHKNIEGDVVRFKDEEKQLI